MALYRYMAPPTGIDLKPKIIYMSEQDILYDFWDHWKYKMEEKYGKDHIDITPDNCIKDWVILHYASEVKE